MSPSYTMRESVGDILRHLGQRKIGRNQRCAADRSEIKANGCARDRGQFDDRPGRNERQQSEEQCSAKRKPGRSLKRGPNGAVKADESGPGGGSLSDCRRARARGHGGDDE